MNPARPPPKHKMIVVKLDSKELGEVVAAGLRQLHPEIFKAARHFHITAERQNGSRDAFSLVIEQDDSRTVLTKALEPKP